MKFFIGGLMVSAVTVTLPSIASEQLSQAYQCAEITTPNQRLTCFDRVFESAKVSSGEKPLSWLLVKRLEQERPEGDLSPRVEVDEKNKRALITLPSQQEGKVLVMSCIDNISRVELYLPEPVSAARVSISVLNGERQSWRSDDSGLIFEASRGLPAISLMKRLMNRESVTLRSSARGFDGLRFETSQVAGVIEALRDPCSW